MPELAERLRTQLEAALPDLIAAARLAYNDFDAEAALDAFAAMRVRHHADIWVQWRFAGASGTLGETEAGDVFVHRRDDGGRELWFDGERAPVVECAVPLSELLTDNRSFGITFRDGLYAWSVATSEASASVQRFRREHGISDDDVGYWRGRVGALALSDADRARWADEVRDLLSPFGTLRVEPAPGMVLRPRDFGERNHASEDAVREALEGLEKLRPRVDFRGPNRLALEGLDTTRHVAAAAERRRGRWTEGLLRDLSRLASVERLEEEGLIAWLDFSAAAALSARLGLPTDHPEPAEDALAFARGQIPLTALPQQPAALSLRSFSSSGASLDARDAQSEEDFLHQARRKAAGGRRAEVAVLDLATSEALRWHREDDAGFERALAPVLEYLEKKGAARLAAIDSAEGMRAFLHVAEYVGNAGFDLLVPRDGTLLLVEVKRVAELSGAAFFLSENERRRATHYRARGLDWRLWLVTGRGETLDATRLLSRFDSHVEQLANLATDGLRPKEWFFVLEGEG